VSDGEGAAPTRGLEFAPAPAGFAMPPVDTGGRDLRALSTNGVCVLLSEAQTDLTGPRRVHTSRLVRAVTGRDGLQAVARFDAVFDPGFERLVIHGIRVIRGGVVREEARPEAFELMRREPHLERAMYDGRMTAHMVIPDLREGDIVDTSFSVTGEQPSLNGAFSWWFVLQWATRVVETTCRVIAPAQRRFLIRRFGGAAQPQITDRDGARVYAWTLRDAEPYEPEPFAPAWSAGYQAVEIGDAMTWSAVSDLFRDMYEGAIAEGTPPELAAEVDAILAREPDPGRRAAEGLRLVQRTLRYHSVAIGEGGFRPRPLPTIWSTRYGDCKDASVLLTAVLRRMGLEACCALVNVGMGADLDNFIPGPRALNHCIVRLRLAGVDYWLDGTMAPQGGDLANLTQARLGWGLPLAPAANLERIAPGEVLVVREAVERWTFPRDISRPTRLECVTVNRSWRADDTRRLIDNRDPRNLGDAYREQLERDLDTRLTEVEPISVTDDGVGNVVTVRELYDVERATTPVSGGGRRFFSHDDLVRPNLPIIDGGRRREPIALGAPRKVVTRREFTFAAPTNFSPWDERIQGPVGLEGHAKFEWLDDRRAVHTISLTVPTPVLPANQAEAYRSFVQRMVENNGVGFILQTRNGRYAASDGGGSRVHWGWIVWLVIVGGVWASRCAGVV
jgi:transglutaminase-like putative cysteine protease